MVMSNVNVNLDSANTSVHVTEKHDLGNRNNNGGRFVDLFKFHCFFIASTLFDHRDYYKISLASAD